MILILVDSPTKYEPVNKWQIDNKQICKSYNSKGILQTGSIHDSTLFRKFSAKIKLNELKL
jgi:hypothetical protein